MINTIMTIIANNEDAMCLVAMGVLLTIAGCLLWVIYNIRREEDE